MATDPHMDTSDENSKPGRKPGLDDAKRREICAILAIGGTRRMAAHYVGCSVDTVGRTALCDPAFAAQIRRSKTPGATGSASARRAPKRKMEAQET
jgi:hypothetical protein